MAVNTIGQNIQLLLSPALGADITQGLQPGDVVQARVAELLPDNRAVIQLNGMNLLAALPQAQPGQGIPKGAILDLAVLQTKAAQAPLGQAASASPASAAAAPALSLKLLGINSSPPSSLLQAAQSQAGPALARPNLESLLAQAQIPVTSANLQAAQSLNRYGLPLDKATLSSVIQSADALLNVETLPQAPAPGGPQPLPASLQNSLAEAKTLLTVLGTQPGNGADRPVLQTLIKQIDSILQEGPAPGSSLSQPKAGAPSADPQEIQGQVDAAVLQASVASPGALQGLQAALESLQAALPQLSGQVSPSPASALSSAQLPAAATAMAPALAPTIQDAIQQPNLPALSPALQPAVLKEVATALIQNLSASIASGTDLNQASLMAQIDQFAAQISQPQATAAGQIVQSAKSQVALPAPPAAEPDPKEPVLEALAQIKDAFISQPLPRSLPSTASLVQAFESRELPAPQVALSSLPRESVLEAVAFLKARSLPITRSLVETVATELSQNRDLGSALKQIADSQQQLPESLMDSQPSLKQSVQDLNSFLNDNSILPDGPDLTAQLQNFVAKSGLNLENRLAQPNAGTQSQDPAASLKSILLKLKDAAQKASSDPDLEPESSVADKLEHLSAQINGALSTMHTLALSAKPTPTFDVTTLQLPVTIGGQMQNGQLSIYWKRGRAHELNNQDPVHVVFLLSTRGLGEVKAQLQVWKSECQCRVTLSSPEARDFMKSGLAELKAGFEANTSFKLNSMEVSANEALGEALSRSLGLLEAPHGLQGATASSLNLSA